MTFETQRFEARNLTIVQKLARDDYPSVFADEPWNEWVKCRTESNLVNEVYFGRSTGLNPKDPCPNCKTPLSPYYEYLPTLNTILAELNEPGTIAVLGLIRGQVAGFAWSYCTNITKLAIDKWKDNPQMQSTIVDTLTPYVSNRFQEVRYFSEVGVLKPYRKQKVASKLSEIVTRDNLPVVVRTNSDSVPMNKICKDLGLKIVIGPDLPIKDMIRSERVLYVTPRN